MFCPGCKYEYERSVKICHDCGMKLVSRLPKEEIKTNMDMETSVLTKVNSQLEGSIIESMLKEYNIECFIHDYTGGYPLHVSLDPGKAWGYIMVNKLKMKKAKEVLEDFKKSS
jgi:hypothetical protein